MSDSKIGVRRPVSATAIDRQRFLRASSRFVVRPPVQPSNVSIVSPFANGHLLTFQDQNDQAYITDSSESRFPILLEYVRKRCTVYHANQEFSCDSKASRQHVQYIQRY